MVLTLVAMGLKNKIIVLTDQVKRRILFCKGLYLEKKEKIHLRDDVFTIVSYCFRDWKVYLN